MQRVLSIVWLYHDLMNLYGDRGNVLILAQRAQARGIAVTVKGISVGEELPTDTDIVFFGGGQDQEQTVVARDLPSKRDQLATLLKRAGGVLAICGGYQLLGTYYQPLHGPRIPGLGLLPVYTKAGTQRMIGDLVIESPHFGTLVGFENHSGQTFITDSAGDPSVHALGRVSIGCGNNGSDKTEGVQVGSAIGTYLHGPILSKNPQLADTLIATGLASHGDRAELRPLPETYLGTARTQALHRAATRKMHGLGLRS